MDFIAPYKAEDFANTGYRLEHIEGRGIVRFGSFHNSKLSVTEALIVIGDERQVDRDGLWHSRVVNALSNPLPVRFVRDFFAEVGHVLWRVGLLHMGQER